MITASVVKGLNHEITCRFEEKFINRSVKVYQLSKIKINKTFNNWTIILHGEPQYSIIGPVLFIVFLCDLFLFIPNTDLVS